jgi:hypothetical protein
MVLQQSSLTLALLYVLPLQGSPYCGNPQMRAWAVAGLRFWAGRQHRDGSFDEYYPFEHGYIPTSFSLYAAAETCRVLELADDAVVAACLRASKYLGRTAERQAVNQEAAAIPGLYATHLLTGDQGVKNALENKLDRFFALQSAEGWFAEYGGADLGYLSTTLDFLAEYWRMSDDSRAFDACVGILEFAQYFIHQDGSAGGQYGSRNTEYFLLSGLSALVGASPVAVAMLQKLRQQWGAPASAYAAFDDRYLCHNMLHSLLRAIRNLPEAMAAVAALPCHTEHLRYFPEAGLLSLGQGTSHLICGLKKGGVIRLFSDGREVFRDFGYRLQRGPGKTAATNWLNDELDVRHEEGVFEVSGHLTEVPQQLVTPWRHMGLRLAARLLGRRLIPSLKKRLIFVDRRSEAHFVRKIHTGREALEIEDRIHIGDTGGRLYPACKFSLRHVASSKYYQADELAAPDAEGWSGVRQVAVHRRVDWVTGAVETHAETS